MTAAQHLLYGGDAVGQADGHLGDAGGAELAQVVAVKGYIVPAGHSLPDELNIIALDTKAVFGGNILTGTAHQVLHNKVVLDAAGQLLPGDAAALGHHQVHGEDDGRIAGVVGDDGGADFVYGDFLEDNGHIVCGIYRHAHRAHLAQGLRLVGVKHLHGGHVQGQIDAGGAVPEEHLEALVYVLRGAGAGELAHGKGAAAIHIGVQAAGVGLLPGEGQAA